MKKLLALLLALVMIFSLAACSGDSGKDDEDEDDDAEGTELEYPLECKMVIDGETYYLTLVDEKNATMTYDVETMSAEDLEWMDIYVEDAEVTTTTLLSGTYKEKKGTYTLTVKKVLGTIEISGDDAEEVKEEMLAFFEGDEYEDLYTEMLEGKQADISDLEGVSMSKITFELEDGDLEALSIYDEEGEYVEYAYTFFSNGKVKTESWYSYGELYYEVTYDRKGNITEEWSSDTDVMLPTDSNLNGWYDGDCYDNGQIIWSSYYENGILLEDDYYYEDGTLSGVYHYYEDGTSKYYASYDADGQMEYEYYCYENGNIQTTRHYDNGVLELTIEYYENGNEASYFSYYENGNTEWEDYYREDGTTIESCRYYENGEPAYQQYYYENGELYQTYSYREDGSPEYYTEYYENGNCYISEHYHENGALNSRYEYYDTGSTQSVSYYDENGVITDRYTYHENGNTARIEYYENGQLSEYNIYDEDGNFVESGEGEASASHSMVQNFEETLFTSITELVREGEYYYTQQGYQVYVGVAVPLSYLSGNSLMDCVVEYGEAYLDLSCWDNLCNAITVDGYAPLTEDTYNWLVTTISGNPAWEEDESYAYVYMVYYR